MASTSVPVTTLPRPALMRQWMAQYHVPAVGIGLVNGNRITSKVYGELSKGIPAPQNTVWSSGALAGAIAMVNNMEDDKIDKKVRSNDLFAELHMPDTAFGDPIKVLNRMARPHNKRDGIYVFKPYHTDKHLFTTVNDYCKLLAHINNQPDVVAGLTTVNEAIEDSSNWRLVNGAWGDQGGIIHCGAGNGSSHVILLLPQSKQAMVIFTNSDNGKMIGQHILNECGIDIISIV